MTKTFLSALVDICFAILLIAIAAVFAFAQSPTAPPVPAPVKPAAQACACRGDCQCKVTSGCNCVLRTGKCECRGCCCGESYKALRARAIWEGKALVVAVGCKPSVPASVLVYHARPGEDWRVDGMIVSAPRKGELYWLADLPPNADVRKVLAVRFTLTPPPASYYQSVYPQSYYQSVYPASRGGC